MYYAVKHGLKPGIYNTWEECKQNVHKVKGAKFKSFKTYELAEHYMNESIPDSYPKEGIACDGGCKGNPGMMKIKMVNLSDKTHRTIDYGYGTNNYAEYLALIHSMIEAQKLDGKVKIYSDSTVAIHWIRNGHPRNNKVVNNKIKSLLQDKIEILKWNKEEWGETPADLK